MKTTMETTTRTTIVTLLSIVLFGLGWAHLELGRLRIEPIDLRVAGAAARVEDRAGGVGIEAKNRYAGGPANPTQRGAVR
jgi:hypothetical protein